MRRFMRAICTLAFTIVLPGLVSQVHAVEKKVKVFILAGQSNMEGHGQVRSLDWLGQHPKYGYLLKKLKNRDGSWAIRDDVTIAWRTKDKKSGPLTAGWGYGENEIGPELMFGTIMGEKYDRPVLLIKTAWGGKSVWCDFRSPGAGEMTWDEKRILERDRLKPGQFYSKMVAEIKECLANIDEVVPGYSGQGYEIAGMAWLQGWNDFCEWHLQLDGKRVGMGLIDRYTHNLTAMSRDLRRDLDAPEMPIVIGELGIGGHEMTRRAQNPDDHEAVAMVKFRKAQKAVADDPSLKNVTFVPTADFWDARLQELRRISDAYWNEKRKKGIKDTEETKVRNAFAKVTDPLHVTGRIKVTQGKKVYEIRPPVDWDKGKAIAWLIAKCRETRGKGGALPVYLGDDLTDEDGFKIIEKNNGISIFVGEPGFLSVARYFLKSPGEVTELLKML